MQYTIARGEKGKIEVKVDVSQADFEKSYGDVLLRLGKDVKVDGFRPGNVPEELLEGKIGASKLLNETASFLVSNHLAEIFDKEAIIPVTKPKVAIDSLAKSSPFSFVASLIERPKVKLGDWKKIKVKKIKAKAVAENDVVESIKNIYDAWKRQKDVSKVSNVSMVSDGEKDATTDDTDENNEDTDGAAGKKFIYDAQGNKHYVSEGKVSDASKVSNESKDEEKEKPSFAEASDDDSTSGINDDFAKKIGARDLAHLKELVRKDLETMVTDSGEQKFEEEIFAELVGLCQVEVPDAMIDDEVNRIMVRINSQLEQQGKKLEDWVREENTTVEALRAKYRQQAEKNVKVTLILDEIGSEEKLQVSKEEIEDAAKGVNQTDLTEEQKVDLQRYLAISIFQAKTLDLVKKAVVVL